MVSATSSVACSEIGRVQADGRAADHNAVVISKPNFTLNFKIQSKDGEEKYEQYHYLPGSFLVEPGKGGDTPVADGPQRAGHMLRARRPTSTIAPPVSGRRTGPGVAR